MPGLLSIERVRAFVHANVLKMDMLPHTDLTNVSVNPTHKDLDPPNQRPETSRNALRRVHDLRALKRTTIETVVVEETGKVDNPDIPIILSARFD